jgi:hypothetical protein
MAQPCVALLLHNRYIAKWTRNTHNNQNQTLDLDLVVLNLPNQRRETPPHLVPEKPSSLHRSSVNMRKKERVLTPGNAQQ